MFDIFGLLNVIPVWIHYALVAAGAVHVLRSRRSGWWILLFLWVPFIGFGVYFFMEWLPELRGRRRVRPSNESAGKRIRRLKEEIEHVDTVERRAHLAEALLAEGDAEEAARQLEICDTGPYRDDPFILLSLITAYLDCENRGQDAMSALERLEDTGNRDKLKLRSLLRSRALATVGRVDEARKEFDKQGSAEGRYRYGMFLKSLGETDAAGEVFDILLMDAKRGSRHWQKNERKWLKLAKEER